MRRKKREVIWVVEPEGWRHQKRPKGRWKYNITNQEISTSGKFGQIWDPISLFFLLPVNNCSAVKRNIYLLFVFLSVTC